MTEICVHEMHETFPTVWDKSLRYAAWGSSLALFLTLGWMVMAPTDPLGAVSLWTRDRFILMWLQAAALGVVSSAVATILAGRQWAEAGVFATALGLSAVALRGATAQFLVMSCAEATPACERAFAFRFAVEAIAWSLVMLLSALSSFIVLRWCGWSTAIDHDRSAADSSRMTNKPLDPAVGASGSNSAATLPVAANRAAATRHVLVAAGFILAVTALLSSAMSDRSVQHGQVCFIVFAAVFLAIWITHRLAPVRGAYWSVLAVPVAVFIAYLWAGIMAGQSSGPPNLPSSCFLRILPIQFVGVGTLAAVTGVRWLASYGSEMLEPAAAAPSTPMARGSR